MVLSLRNYAPLFSLLAASLAAPTAVNAQTVISGPTATTQILDFRAPDGIWENEERTFLNAEGVEETITSFPEFETFTQTTRTTGGFAGTALEGLTSEFTGLSQNADGALQGISLQNDFVNQTFFGQTNIINLSRFDTPVNAPTGRAGALQWSFDLNPLDSYLSDNSLSLDALELNVRAFYQGFGFADNIQGRFYHLLLSYTNPEEGITLGDISTTIDSAASGSEDNYQILHNPATIGSVGDLLGDDPRTTGEAIGDFDSSGVVNAADFTVWRDTVSTEVTPGEGADADGSGEVGLSDLELFQADFGNVDSGPEIEPATHKLVAQSVRSDVDEFSDDQHITTIDFLELYDQGIREFSLALVTAGFGPNRPFGVVGPAFTDPNDPSDPLSFGSGIYVTTSEATPGVAAAAVAVPEPAALSLLLLAAAGFTAKRRGKV